MAILNSCCCCRSVRRGSYACAIYSMIYYSILAASLWKYLQHPEQPEGDEEMHDSILMGEEEYHDHFPVIRYLGIVMLTLSLAGPVTCIFLIIGLRYNIRLMLLPWIVDAVLIIMLDMIFVGYIVYQEQKNMHPVVALTFTLDFFLLVLNIYAVLCVISQYQDYLDGRGTARDDGSRSPPTIRYSRQSTMNSGLDSTRRTVTFLEQGSLPNGLSTAPNSRVQSVVHKDGIFSDEPNSYAANNHLPSGPEVIRATRNGKKHVQFPADTIEESETSDGETCAIITSKEDVVDIAPVCNSSSSCTKDQENKVSSLSCIPKDVSKERQMSCMPSSRGPEATPLIKSESSDEVARY